MCAPEQIRDKEQRDDEICVFHKTRQLTMLKQHYSGPIKVICSYISINKKYHYSGNLSHILTQKVKLLLVMIQWSIICLLNILVL